MTFARVTIFASALAFLTVPAFAKSTEPTHHHATTHHHHHAQHPHHSCHGMSSGTSHHHCGTRTGGPVGGLH